MHGCNAGTIALLYLFRPVIASKNGRIRSVVVLMGMSLCALISDGVISALLLQNHWIS